jgi:hypothetical protein
MAAVITCAACTDGGGAFVSSASAHFAPGVTTRADAVKALGPPSSVYEAANGEKTLSWARDGGLFNPDDKMIRTVPTPKP